MEDQPRLNKLLTSLRDREEIENWIFSLIPILVAFAFYMVFIMNPDIENKHQLISYGAAAGFTGLESYWILRGWRNDHMSTIILGIIGIAATLGILYL